MTLSITKPLRPLVVAAGITPPHFVSPREGYRNWAKVIQDTVPAGCYMVNYPYDPSLAVEAAATLKEVSGARVIVQLSADELCHIGSVDGVYLTPSYKTAATVEEALRIVRAKNSGVDLVCNIDMPSKQLSPSDAAERVREMFEIGCTVGVISPWIDWN